MRTRRDSGIAEARRCAARAAWCRRRAGRRASSTPREPVAISRRPEVETQLAPVHAPGRRGGGTGRAAAGFVDPHDVGAEPGAARARRVAPPTPTRARRPSPRRRRASRDGRGTAGAARRFRRTATAGSIHSPASRSIASAGSIDTSGARPDGTGAECRDIGTGDAVHVEGGDHGREVGPRRRRAGVHPAVGGPQQHRRREQPDRTRPRRFEQGQTEGLAELGSGGTRRPRRAARRRHLRALIRPGTRGARLSKKAAMPSARSAVVESSRLRSDSTRCPSAMVRSRPRCTASRAAACARGAPVGKTGRELLGVRDGVLAEHARGHCAPVRSASIVVADHEHAQRERHASRSR